MEAADPTPEATRPGGSRDPSDPLAPASAATPSASGDSPGAVARASDRRIGRRLVAAGLVEGSHVEEALRAQRSLRGSTCYHLLRLGRVSPQALSEFLELEIVAGRLGAPEPPTAAPGLDVLPARLALLYNVYPLGSDERSLELAVPPHHGDAVHAVADATGRSVEPFVMPAEVLRAAVERDYLGMTNRGITHPAAGLSHFLVDDGAAVRPLAPELRTRAVSPEAWLRSILGEAIGQRRRVVELPGEGPGAAADGVVRLVEEIAGLPLGESARLDRAMGRFQLGLRGRRPIGVVVRDAGGRRIRIHLAEQRFVSTDADEVFEGLDDGQQAVEALAQERRGLVLICGASGGGSRRLVQVLGSRLSEILDGSVLVTDGAPAAGGTWEVRPATGDGHVARALQEAAGRGAGFLVAEELPGPRSVERALLAASRVPVLAGFIASDAVAALAWLSRQGLTGALKTGLLRGILSVLAIDESCAACSMPASIPAELLRRFGRDSAPGDLRANAGCPACLEMATRRTIPLVTWTPVEGRPESWLIEHEEGARRALREAGGRTLLDLAVESSSGPESAPAGSGPRRGEIGSACQLLRALA